MLSVICWKGNTVLNSCESHTFLDHSFDPFIPILSPQTQLILDFDFHVLDSPVDLDSNLEDILSSFLEKNLFSVSTIMDEDNVSVVLRFLLEQKDCVLNVG